MGANLKVKVFLYMLEVWEAFVMSHRYEVYVDSITTRQDIKLVILQDEHSIRGNNQQLRPLAAKMNLS